MRWLTHRGAFLIFNSKFLIRINYLGIDWGEKRIGLAYADEVGIAVPLPAAVAASKKARLQYIEQMIKARRIDEIVCGYPLNMNGSVGFKAKEVDVFIATLEKSFAMPVHRVDERLTSLAAEESLGVQSNKRKKKDWGKIDASAAGIILRDFIENRNVIPPPQS